MRQLKDKYRKRFFSFITSMGKLNDHDVINLLKANFKNLNKIKGNSTLQCLFPNCRNIGVISSHLYSKSFLKIIAENGKLYTKSHFPEIIGTNLEINLNEIGINEAMTFPGFCKSCENRFTFEKNLFFENSQDYYLQLLRTVCYEKRLLEIEINSNSSLIKEITSLSRNKLSHIFNPLGVKIESISGVNSIESFMMKRNKMLLKQLQKVNRFYEKFCLAFNDKFSIKIYVIKLPTSLPFFANYVGSIRMRKFDKEIRCNTVINIHPVGPMSTEVFFTDFSKHLTINFFKHLSNEEQINFFAGILKLSSSPLIQQKYWDTLTLETQTEILKLDFF